MSFAIVFPVAYAVAIKAVLFDGMRHFIFVLPPIAVAAALVADRALVALWNMPYRQLVYATLGLYGVIHLGTMVMLHPDQYVYYNAFVGGVEGAQHKFKLDYWANSYAEAVQGLEDHLRARDGADFQGAGRSLARRVWCRLRRARIYRRRLWAADLSRLLFPSEFSVCSRSRPCRF